MAGEIKRIGGANLLGRLTYRVVTVRAGAFLRTPNLYKGITVKSGGYLRTASQYTPTGNARVIEAPVIRALPWRYGQLRIAGTLKTVGPPLTPAQRRVLLLERDSMRVVRGMYSNADGSYAFENLDDYPPGYIVMGIDHLNIYNADIADNIQAGV